MIFTNPWGLLTLLALPAILGLHFFRSQRRVRVIGGLHLWQFAQTRLPVGRKLQRILRSLSLLFQLLAALVLALLASGFDLPRDSAARRYTIIIDDTLSMGAGAIKTAPHTGAVEPASDGGADSSVARAREFLKSWAPSRATYTLIAAGARPRVLAGPSAASGEMLNALDAWRPEATACNLDEAVNLASKFAVENEKPLILTDRPDLAEPYAANAVVHGLGRALGNAGIEFADRRRIAENKDRILLRLHVWADAPRELHLLATINGQKLLEKSVACEADAPQEFTFETERVNDAIELTLAPDALAADNTVKLAPAIMKRVIVGLHGLEKQGDFFRRAALAVPFVRVVEGFENANLVFSTLESALPTERPFHLCMLPDSFLVTQSAIAQGRAMWLDRRDPVVENLTMEGVLWAYDPQTSETLRNASALIAYGGRTLMSAREGARGSREYRMNLLVDRGNLFAQPAWPAMMQRMVEGCRDALPGLTRSNFRVGEIVALHLFGDGASAGPAGPPKGAYILTHDGAEVERYDAPPESIVEPAPGEWKLTRATAPVIAPAPVAPGGAPAGAVTTPSAAPITAEPETLAHFCVNLFAPQESDLRAGASNEFKADALESAAIRRPETNRPLFYGLLLLLIAFIAAGWICQDISR